MPEKKDAKVEGEPIQLEEDPKKAVAEGKQDDPRKSAEALLTELEKFGVRSSEDLTGLAQAAQQTGHLQNLLGDVKRENKELREMIEQLRSQGRRSELEPLEPAAGEPIDLGSVVRKEISSFWQEQVEEQRRAQERQLMEMAEVMQDEYYPQVKEIFDAHIGNPAVAYKVQAGQSSYAKEYDKVVKKYLHSMLKRSQEVLKGLTQATSGTKPPHMESGETKSAPLPPAEEEKRESMRKIDDARRKGSLDSDKALEQLIEQVLPKEDPILRRG